MLEQELKAIRSVRLERVFYNLFLRRFVQTWGVLPPSDLSAPQKQLSSRLNVDTGAFTDALPKTITSSSMTSPKTLSGGRRRIRRFLPKQIGLFPRSMESSQEQIGQLSGNNLCDGWILRRQQGHSHKACVW